MGIDFSIDTSCSKSQRFVLAITNYFFKRAETVSLKEVKASDIVAFIKHHTILAYSDGSSVTMNPSSLVKLSIGCATSFGFRASSQWL